MILTTYQDLFPSSTIMKQFPGNGTITIPGAGDARLIAPNSVNCQFYAGDAAGRPPILYDTLGSMWQMSQPGQALFLETKLSVFTGTTNLRIAGLALFKTFFPGGAEPFYSYQMGWYKSDGKLHVWYDYPGVETEVVTAVMVTDPASTPHLYRIYYNPTSRPLYIAEVSAVLDADTLLFAYSINAGTTWTSTGTRARDFSFSRVFAGLYVRKWETSAVSAQADFEYFRATQYNETDQVLNPLVGKGGQETLGLEDQAVPRTLSGLPRFDYSDVGGDVAFTPPTPVAFEDQGGLLTQGGAPRFDLPEIAGAPVVPSDRIALEEALFVQLDNTDYIKAKYDADGKEYLGNYGVRHIMLYDATADPWHTHGAGFYGAGRNGKLYYDGVECGPGSFGTLANGRRKTAWASNGDFIDVGNAPLNSYVYGPAPTITADDEMQFALTTSHAAAGVSSRMRWFFTGDFDVQVDYEIVSAGAGPTDGGLYFFAIMDLNNMVFFRRHMWTAQTYDYQVKNNGGWVNYAQVATADTSGKMRITRVGSTVSVYYWNGSSWVQLGSSYAMTHAKPMYIDCFLAPHGGTANVTVKLRNFTINSGSTTNLIGWAREAAGTYRGSLAEFPQHALIVSSGNSLDIIDADTDKLWMSFRGVTNNLIGGPDANYYVNQVVMKDGTLFVAYRTLDTATSTGQGFWIDFTLDFVRLHRGTAPADAGYIYNVELTTSVWPRDSANGCIAFRNSACAYYSSHFDNWQYQDPRANWVDILHDGGYQYRLIANNGGVYLAKWQRWKFEGTGNAHLNTPDYAIGTQTVATRWTTFRPTSRDILAHNRIKLWITHYATWNVVMGGGGGTWLEDHEYSLAGSVDANANGALAQDSMTLDDAAGLLFYARNEGVYAMDLSTGSSTLIYGKAGSGATHEVLGDYTTISSVKLATDGATPLLIVGMARPDRIWAINRGTHAVYWRGFQDDAHQPLSMAVGA
jgi:hypothetical protein